MKVHRFEAMTREEAKEYLSEFLAFGRNEGLQILGENLHFTTELDFRIETSPDILQAVIPTLKTVPRDPDSTVPEFIRNTEDYQKGLFDFDERSNSILLASAYYLGETFVRSFPRLRWDTGNTDYREGNMPVIVPFSYNMQMAPILIVENMFGGVVSGMREIDSIGIAIQAWREHVPN